MKYKIALTLLLLCISKFSVGQTNDSTFYNQIKLMDLSNFKGKPIDSLLSHIPNNFTYHFVKTINNGKLRRVVLQYPDKSEFILFVKSYQFINPSSEGTGWLFEDYRKETLTNVWIFHPVFSSIFP